jgi:hypothetical protein
MASSAASENVSVVLHKVMTSQAAMQGRTSASMPVMVTC